ncbi:OLC1v1005983C1 [Oldenlandia corymbosa var. corymbosa]|uniref:OLC1v1005983C1 n=1 Tax=Oldenlandia corymbosa var. corymbosa TaxID=529605 RepID=A0AAV1DID4_OLDCO|nr:OLC1v1005983C1 [Oldenlandia corymbosa var. corymbosa]
MVSARCLFDEMSNRELVSWNSLISGYSQAGFHEESKKLYRDMLALEGVHPNGPTLDTWLMVSLRDPVLSTWNAIISGHVKNNQFQGALDFFREMLEFGARPSIVTISSILAALSHLSDLKVAKERHPYAIKHDYEENVYVATGIVDNYAKFGFISGAKTVFVRTRDRSVVIGTAIISGYAAQGDTGVALYLFNEMLNEGLQPDPVTFTALLGACARAGLVEESWFLFRSLVPNYGIEPIAEHYC